LRRPAPRWAHGPGRRPSQHPDGVLPVIAGDLADLVQDAVLLRAGGRRYRW
jgi:hypothetical protein